MNEWSVVKLHLRIIYFGYMITWFIIYTSFIHLVTVWLHFIHSFGYS
jgi:hypothetical protein